MRINEVKFRISDEKRKIPFSPPYKTKNTVLSHLTKNQERELGKGSRCHQRHSHVEGKAVGAKLKSARISDCGGGVTMEDDHRWDGSEDSEQALTSNLLCLRSSKLQQTQLQECSMVVIRDILQHNDCSVFPPVNHENLHISSFSHQCDDISTSPSPSSTSCSSFSSSDSSFSPSDTDTWGSSSLSSSLPSNSPVEKIDGFTGWMRIGLKTLRGKLFAMVSSYRNYAANKSAIWSIGPAFSMVILLWWMCVRVRCWLKGRRRGRRQRENLLMTVIKEKDERIAQLLERIVQMNEILVARHKALAAKLAE